MQWQVQTVLLLQRGDLRLGDIGPGLSELHDVGSEVVAGRKLDQHERHGGRGEQHNEHIACAPSDVWQQTRIPSK